LNDKLKVFIYKNSRNEIVATLQKPNIALNEFAFLEVKSNTEQGTFLDWGLDKDLFVPFREQITTMKEGHRYLVYLYFDKKSERLAATTKTKKFIETSNINLKTGKEINILITEKKELGYSVIIENAYAGMIYDNEIFRKIKPGDKMKAYVKNVRDDGKVDVSLQQLGYKNITTDAEKIIEKLQQNNGVLYLNDKSNPDDIQLALQMSKKAFKRAIGNLYEKKLILIKDDGIYLKTPLT
ncbi:MAG: GntR family transcriptional regulator, partial [Chlorobi bacterium]|nr:GntR family transcriptional regulator [Chlorobiota bacterium]